MKERNCEAALSLLRRANANPETAEIWKTSQVRSAASLLARHRVSR